LLSKGGKEGMLRGEWGYKRASRKEGAQWRGDGIGTKKGEKVPVLEGDNILAGRTGAPHLAGV